MKKFLLTISLILCAGLIISGCSEHKKHETFIATIANDGVITKIEKSFWTGEYLYEKQDEEKECKILEYSLTGKYSRSIFEKYNSFITDIFIDENGIAFGINRDSNKIVYLNLMNKMFFDNEPFLEDVDDPEEYSVAFAKQIAVNFIENLEEYSVLKHEPITRIKEKDGKQYTISYYTITFYKLVDGYKTSDYISIRITSKGHLASIKVGDTNVFENKSVEIDAEALQKSINDKIYQTYKDAGYSVIDVSLKNQYLVKAYDGNFYCLSEIETRIEDKGKNEVSTIIALISNID